MSVQFLGPAGDPTRVEEKCFLPYRAHGLFILFLHLSLQQRVECEESIFKAFSALDTVHTETMCMSRLREVRPSSQSQTISEGSSERRLRCG